MDLRSPSLPSSSSPSTSSWPASAWTSAASVLVGGNSNPTFWVVSWVMINISLTLLNKSVFQFVHFQYPFTLSACHMLCLYLFCFLIYRVLHLAPQDQISTTTRNRIYMLSLLFTLNICAGNAGLMFSSVSLREVVRSLTPVITMGFSIWLLGKTYGSSVIWSLVPITFGVGITTYTELEFHFWGFVILLVGCALAALKGVLSNILLVGTHSVTPLYLLFFIAPLAFLQMVFLAYLLGEIDQIILNWEDVSQPLTILMVTSTAILAFFLNVTNFHLNKVTSPLTVSVAGSFKEVVTIGMSFMVFKNKVTGLNLLGIAIALSGTFLYHYNSAHSKQPTTTKNKMDKETSDASLREEGHTTRRKDSLAQFELEEK